MQGSINFDGSLVGNITGGGGGGGDEVIITPVVTSGTKIADVSVNGVEKDLYCPTPPTPPEVEITPVVTSGTKIADVSVGGVEKDLYAPNPTEVNVNQVQQSGTKIATIGVNGVEKDLYCPTPPTPPEVEITPVVTSGTKIADVSVGGVEKDLYTPDYGADIAALDGRLDIAEDNIASLTGRVGTAEGNITNLAGHMTEAETDITEIKQSLSDLENVIDQIDGVTIYKQILNQDIVSFSAENSMPIMKLISNISNVSGYTEANITVCGTNIWDEEWEVVNNRLSSKNYIPIKPNTTYLFCSALLYSITGFDINKNNLGGTSYTQVPNVGFYFTTKSNWAYIKFNVGYSYGTTYKNDISINYPPSDTSYHAYNGNTYNIPFVDGGGNTLTIYDGSIDLISGLLIDNDNTTTYQLNANPIDDLQGQNNIWSDIGSIANVGYLDILNIS